MVEVRKGTIRDIDEVSALYDELNDYLECHINYPGWIKGVYPTHEDAIAGVNEQSLFVAMENGKIVGTIILRHKPEDGYELADWHNDLEYKDIFVVYTFAVHPQFLNRGIGKKLMEFVIEYAIQMNVKGVRLDVYEKNIPAIRLYEKLEFQYIDTVDLGYGEYGLDLFKLYQLLL